MERRLGDLARIRTGRTPFEPTKRGAYGDDGVPFVRVKDITRSNGYLSSTEYRLGDFEYESIKAQKDSVLLSISGTIGVSAVLEIDACFNQAIVALDRLHNLIPEYLMFNLMARKLELLSFAYGTCQLNINQDVVKNTMIKVVSLDEQMAIAEQVRDIIALARLRKQQVEKLERLTTALIQEKFRR